MALRPSITYDVKGDTRQLEQKVNSVARKTNPLVLKLDANKFALGRITGKVTEFNKSLEASNARVIAFGASAGLITGVTKAFSDLIDAMITVEKKLKDINVILNASSTGIVKFGNSLFDVARLTGKGFEEVADSAAEFARQGLGVEETLKRTRDALILSRLAIIGSVEATNSLTAAVNTFRHEALDSTTIINKLAEVDAKFAVSSADLANAIQRAGATAIGAKVSFDELLAIVTAVQQQTARGGNIIGNALKTIFTRIQRTSVLNQLEELGVAVRDMEGNFRPALQILKEVAQGFDSLTDSQRAHTTELLGGVRQVDILRAGLRDLGQEYSIYNEALSTSVNAMMKLLNETKS